jgi:hypothetical protein
VLKVVILNAGNGVGVADATVVGGVVDATVGVGVFGVVGGLEVVVVGALPHPVITITKIRKMLIITAGLDFIWLPPGHMFHVSAKENCIAKRIHMQGYKDKNRFLRDSGVGKVKFLWMVGDTVR